MKYVLDSSVALKWVLAEPDSGRAIRLRDEYRNGIHELHAPDLFAPEIGNALAVAERQGRISKGAAAIHFLDIGRNTPFIHAYDCVYVALGELEQCEFVTADDLLVRNLRPTFPFLIRLADVP